MTINKHVKRSGPVLLALFGMWGSYVWLINSFSRPLAIAGAVLFIALGLFIAYKAGRLFVFVLRQHPIQLIAVGVWIMVAVFLSFFLLVARHM